MYILSKKEFNPKYIRMASYKGYDRGPFGYKTGVRQYDPETGRFLSPDPFKGYMTDPASQHPYMYCRGNPIRYSDPSGYWKWEIKGNKAFLISEKGDTLKTLNDRGFPTKGMSQPKKPGERWDFTFIFNKGKVAGNLGKIISNCNCAGVGYTWILNFNPNRADYKPSDVRKDLSNQQKYKGKMLSGKYITKDMKFGDTVFFGSGDKHVGIFLTGEKANDTWILSQWGDNGPLKITTLKEVIRQYGKPTVYFRYTQ